MVLKVDEDFLSSLSKQSSGIPIQSKKKKKKKEKKGKTKSNQINSNKSLKVPEKVEHKPPGDTIVISIAMNVTF